MTSVPVVASATHVPQSESESERLHRLYSSLRHVNQAILTLRTREGLFRSVCEILVEHGRFGTAWIGWRDPETHRVVPVAHAGRAERDVEQRELGAHDTDEVRGPSDKALSDERPYICNDVSEDGGTLPWCAALERRGFRACAAFPIAENGVVSGTISVYAGPRGFFRNEEIELLAGVASDISLALHNLAREATHERSDELVKRFVAIVESTDDAIVSKTLDGTITSWNAAAEHMFGYSASEVVGRSIQILIPDNRPDEEPMILRRIRAGERIKQFETVRKRKDGTLFPVSITVSPIWSGGRNGTVPTVVGVSKIVRDVTERKRAEAVAEREQRFANGLIEAMPGVFYLCEADGRLLRWNRNLERVSGYSPAEITALPPFAFFSNLDKRLVQKSANEALEHGEATVEAPIVAKDGGAVPYFFIAKRIAFDGAAQLVVVGVDIAQRTRAELSLQRSEERYRTTLDTILEACQILSFDWRYLYLNPAAAVQNRRANAELLGRQMQDVWPGIEDSKLLALLRRSMEQRLRVHAETEFTFTDGSTSWLDVRVQPVPEGVFVLSIDISERKQAEAALRELNEKLELKVAERTVDLDAARERAEAADRIKSAFLATMSHELRTPLNSILGFTGIVLKEMAGPLTAEQSKQLGMVQGSARHLLGLINDVLDISKIEAGQLQVRCAPFALSDSIQRVAASVTPFAEKKQLSLRVLLPKPLGPMHSDRVRVEQILINLLNNGIKFTDRGEVTLGVELTEERHAGGVRPVARIRVADTGIGIKEEDLAMLFQPFRQIDSGLERQHEGTGLGLAICHRLTALLGGSISVTSQWGRGSVFTVVLPMTGDVSE